MNVRMSCRCDVMKEPMKEPPYEILKIVRCKISDYWCNGTYLDINSRAKPDCKNCYIYKDFKKSGLSYEEYREQDDNALNGAPEQNDDDENPLFIHPIFI